MSYRPERLRNYRDFLEANTDLYAASYPWMVNRGLFMTPGDEEQWTLSVQHTEADIDRYVDAFAELCAALGLTSVRRALAVVGAVRDSGELVGSSARGRELLRGSPAAAARRSLRGGRRSIAAP